MIVTTVSEVWIAYTDSTPYTFLLICVLDNSQHNSMSQLERLVPDSKGLCIVDVLDDVDNPFRFFQFLLQTIPTRTTTLFQM